MKVSMDSTRARKARRGMTLIEVILAMVILSILAVMATTALFYPRLLVVNSGLEQSAIHAGIGELERRLHNHLAPVDPGIFNTDGWVPTAITTITNIYTESVPGTIGDDAEYLEIEATVEYRDGKTVELVTYRSLEVSSSER